jgi:hypothetical protein
MIKDDNFLTVYSVIFFLYIFINLTLLVHIKKNIDIAKTNSNSNPKLNY